MKINMLIKTILMVTKLVKQYRNTQFYEFIAKYIFIINKIGGEIAF